MRSTRFTHALALTLGVLFGSAVLMPAATVSRSTRASVISATWDCANCPADTYDTTAVAACESGAVAHSDAPQVATAPAGSVTHTWATLVGTNCRAFVTAKGRTSGRMWDGEPITLTGVPAPPITPTPTPTATPTATPTPTPTVTPPPPTQVASVSLSKNPVNEGETVQATAKDAAGNVVTGVVWSVEHTFMATIDQTGLITNVALTGPVAGRPTANVGIRAALNGVTVSAILTVNAGAVPTPTPTPTPTVTPTPTPTPIAAPLSTIAVKTCSVTLTAVPPSGTGWRAQFKRDANVSVGTLDAAAPFSRTSTLNAGTYSFYVVWSKLDGTTVTSQTAAGVCH